MHTPQSNAKAQNEFVPGYKITLTLLIIAIAMTGVIFAWLVYGVSYSYSAHIALRERALRIQELRGIISHLDEVLTMSARMAATMGNPMWEERYRRFEPQLDAAIKEAITLAPGIESAQSAEQTDAANSALVDMENRAFQLVREQREEDAQAVLFSEAYETQKRIYAEGMQKFIEALGESLHTEAHTERHQIIRAIVAFVVVLAISICA